MAKEKKRRREESDASVSEDRSRDDVEKVEGTCASISASADEYAFWLIRKPAKIPLGDLSELKFPHRAKRRSATLMSPNSHAALNCHFEPARTQMLHIPMNNIRTQKDAIKLKAVNELCGTVFITEHESVHATIEANDSTDDVQNGSGEDATFESSFEIHSIRKKPKLPLEGVRERVRAFGVVLKKKKDKLPNLINNN